MEMALIKNDKCPTVAGPREKVVLGQILTETEY
jgi:hypothetical protein